MFISDGLCLIERLPVTSGRRIEILAALFLIVASLTYAFAPALASPGQGTFSMTISNTTLNGSLQNTVIQADSVSMNMVLNGNLQTSFGQVPITTNGIWVGTRNGTQLNGTIQDVTGTIHLCFLFWCGQANFIGQGVWNGNLTSTTTGAGSFDGTITFTSSDFSQIHLNEPAPVSGTWNAEFQLA